MPAPPTSHPLASHAVWDRRELIRRALVAGVVTGGAAAFGGCGLSSSSATSGGGPPVPAGTTPPSLVPVRYDAASPYWMQGNYAPVADEVEAFGLEVSGALPAALTGLYVRNGSNPASGNSTHWFLGDGMVHGVRLARGRAEWYRNRYVHTPLYEAKKDLLGAGAPGQAKNQSNVSVFHHGGRLLTSGEVGFPYELSPDDLGTIGPYDFGGRLATAMTAHPKVDPRTGRMHFFGYGFVPPYLTYHVADADGTLVSSEQVQVAGPTMMHDFAITDRDVVFWELPVVFDLQAAIAAMDPAKASSGGRFPFQWEPSYGARIGIMPLGGPAAAIRWVEIEPCYVFHGVNAYRDGDDVVIDVCRLPSMFRPEPDDRPNAVHRWTVGTGGESLTFRDEVLSEIQMDLPAIDRRRVGLPYENAWFLDVAAGPDGVNEFTGLTRRTTGGGALDRFDAGERYRMNEATFVPDSERAGDGEGWLLSFGWDRARGARDLMVFVAGDLAAGPVASVHLPTRVPYGFHGWWVPDRTS